ncbi:alpha/beta hydrolase [Nocardia sp. NPDC057668]|uniref:alpha/beta hydrolase n=1 Tax=Nocardia sp. NPDC057668 TaxID=3346202 RepID=UPI00366C64A8
MSENRIQRSVTALVAAGVVVAGGAACEPSGGERQVIAWHDCRTGAEDAIGARLSAVGAQCGEFSAPLDYDDPGGRTITIAVARRAATDQTRRLGTLVVQTGGPGPSRDGVPMVIEGPEGGHPGAAELAERYDLVGMDPRFFGASSPLECGWKTSDYLALAQTAPADRAGFDRTVAVAGELARRCEPDHDLLPHASTRNVARDLDLLRGLLNESELSFLGWSWGTYVGAVYLQMFGEHSGRFVLDSALDPRAPGPDLTRATAPAASAALQDWARWAAERPELGWGAAPDAVLSTIDGMLERVAAAPVALAGVAVTRELMPGLMLTVDDSDATYTDFAAQLRALSDASLGVPVDLPDSLAAKLALYAETTVLPELGFSATVANQCADRPARDTDAYFTDIEDHRAAEPIYGALARRLTPCSLWPVRPTETATGIGNELPVLLVGAEGDPVAPEPGQRAMRRALAGSRSVTLKKAVRHGVYLFERNPCVDDAISRYLLDGTLPVTDLNCTREG